MRLPSWLARAVCFLQGHNLIGMDLPVGWSVQTCRTCGRPTEAFVRERP